MNKKFINKDGNPKSIIVKSVRYKSIKSAAAAFRIPASICRGRLSRLKKKGIYSQKEIDKIFSKPYVPAKKPIRVLGVEYKSIQEAIEANGLSEKERIIRSRLERLVSPNEMAINECFFRERKKPITVTVNNVEFRSIADAAKTYGISHGTALSRINSLAVKNKKNISECFTKKLNDFSLVVEGKKFDSIIQASERYNIPYKVILRRINKLTKPSEIQIDQCFLRPPKKSAISGKIKVNGVEYSDLYEACNIHEVSYSRILDKLRKINKKSELTQYEIDKTFFPEQEKKEYAKDGFFILKSSVTNQKPLPNERQLDLSKLKPNSLGMLTIQASQGKIAQASISYFCEAVKELIGNNSMLSILQKEIGDISRNEIVSLFTFYEERIARKDLKKRGTISSQVRNAFKLVDGELLDGGTIAAASKLFKTSLHDDSKKPRPILSESYDPYFEKEEELCLNISKVKFKSLDELKIKIIRHLKARTKRFENVWWNVVDEYLKEKEYFSLIRSGEYSEEVNEILSSDWLSIHPRKKKTMVDDLKAREILQLNLGLVDKYYIKRDGFEFLNKNISSFVLESGNFFKKERVNFNLYSQTTEMGYYLCDKFIPGHVLYSIRCLLQSWFGFNAHTAQNLRLIDIDYKKSNARKIIITPNKSKTGYDQVAEIKFIPHSRKTRLINLLIDNYKELLSWESKLSDESLFIQLIKDTKNDRYQFRPLNDQTNKKNLLNNTNLPYYSNEQIRDQHLVTLLAESGNVWEAMHVAGHKTLKTLISYADQRILRIANDANINDFTKKLEATIVWATRGHENEVKKMGLSIDDIDDTLLFPITEYGYEEDIPEVDKWIRYLESGESKIPLTDMRIEWCLRQYYYYALNWKALSQSNPERFKQVHLPRVLMTISLKKIIQDKMPIHYNSVIALMPENMMRLISEKNN